MEDLELIFETATEGMNSAFSHLEKELAKVRAGKASPSMLDSVKVEYYGAVSPISQIANITTPDAKTIFIQPWDKNSIPVIEKAIMNANLGFNPANNGEVIRIIVPPVTEEKRKQLAKQVRTIGEDIKVTIRSERRDAIDEIKKLQKAAKNPISEDVAKDAEQKVHKKHEEFITKIDKAIEIKEKEILTV